MRTSPEVGSYPRRGYRRAARNRFRSRATPLRVPYYSNDDRLFGGACRARTGLVDWHAHGDRARVYRSREEERRAEAAGKYVHAVKKANDYFDEARRLDGEIVFQGSWVQLIKFVRNNRINERCRQIVLLRIAVSR